MANDYSDIIALPRHVSRKYSPMDVNNRAAQFTPYAALVGHRDIIADNESLAAQKTDLDGKISLVPEDES